MSAADKCKQDLIVMHHDYGIQLARAIQSLAILLELQGKFSLVQVSTDKGWEEGAPK